MIQIAILNRKTDPAEENLADSNDPHLSNDGAGPWDGSVPKLTGRRPETSAAHQRRHLLFFRRQRHTTNRVFGSEQKILNKSPFFTHWRCVKRCHVFPVLLGDTLGCTSWGWAGWREDEASRPPPTSSPESRNCNKIIMRIQQKNLSFSLNYFVKKIFSRNY